MPDRAPANPELYRRVPRCTGSPLLTSDRPRETSSEANGTMPGAAGAQSLQPRQWDAGVRMAEAIDRNPDPDIVEVDFEARVATVEIMPTAGC